MILKGKRALVTGGAVRIGKAIVQKLQKAGVGFFKIVGRGVNADTLAKRIRIIHAALEHDDVPDYPDFCSHLINNTETCKFGYRCYYRD